MTASRRYLIGLMAVGVLGLATVFLARPSLRKEIAVGELIGLLVQAPLGWWTLRSIGREKFQLVWVGGMITRLAVVALAALALAGNSGWQPGTLLMTLVGTLLVLLFVEAAVAVREHSRSDGQ